MYVCSSDGDGCKICSLLGAGWCSYRISDDDENSLLQTVTSCFPCARTQSESPCPGLLTVSSLKQAWIDCETRAPWKEVTSLAFAQE